MEEIKPKQVKVVVSATDYYLVHILPFLESLHNLFNYEADEDNFGEQPPVKYEFNVIVITNKDNKLLNSQLEFEFDEIVIQYYKYNIKQITIEYCPNFPWPVLTLYKPFLLSKYIDINNDFNNDDYAMCCNVNLQFEKNNQNWFNENKINVSWHHTHADNNHPYYIQGGFVFGQAEKMKELCELWQNRINYYINHDHIVPAWHDETVLNELFNDEKYHDLFYPTFVFKYEGQDKNKIMPDAFAELNISKVKPEFKINY